MKKVYMALFAAAGVMMGSNVQAHDSTGCGLGSMAWRGQQGAIPQILAVTTNGTFGTQTFGISSGTSGCDPDGRISGGTQRMVFNFIENNMEQFALDSAKGEGETLTTLAGILEMDEAKLAEVSKVNFASLFPNQDADALFVTAKLFEILQA